MDDGEEKEKGLRIGERGAGRDDRYTLEKLE
jgi:hypothetical protein